MKGEDEVLHIIKRLQAVEQPDEKCENREVEENNKR